MRLLTPPSSRQGASPATRDLSPGDKLRTSRTSPLSRSDLVHWHLASFAAMHKIATRSEVCGHRPAPGPNRPCDEEVRRPLVDAVLHYCIRPLIGACAPGHHGYQRACDLILGQASNGLNGSPVFTRAGKTDPPSSSHPLADLGR